MNGFVHQGDDVTIGAPGVSARSVIGRRHSQQDAVAVASHLVAVADGMGGHVRGEEASVAALEALVAAAPEPCTVGELADAAGSAQDAVAALADGSFRNPGSTLVALAVSDDAALVHGVWCGDSRAWVIEGDGAATALSFDHAYSTGGLYACLGEHGDTAAFRVDTFSVEVGRGFRVLLSSDGAHGWLGRSTSTVASTELAGLAAAGVTALVDVATERDTDNATAVLVDIDTWVASVRPRRPARRHQVLRRRQGGEWEAWVAGSDARGRGATVADCDADLARQLTRWAGSDAAASNPDLAAVVHACDGDPVAVSAALER